MNNFDPNADRLKQARDAATLARLRSIEPGAAERIEAAATREPDPAAVHSALLHQNFPGQWFPRGWVPDLRDLACLAILRAYFSRKPAPRRSPDVERAEACAEFARRFGRR